MPTNPTFPFSHLSEDQERIIIKALEMFRDLNIVAPRSDVETAKELIEALENDTWLGWTTTDPADD